MQSVEQFEEALNDFDAEVRRAAVRRLIGPSRATAGAVAANVGMHFHSFYSFNALDYSPSRLAWESNKAGLYAAALCDFDVLDGLEEFMEAGRMLGLRTAVHMETRSFLGSFADVEITSPGEPGVAYVMGAGFPRSPAAGTAQAEKLRALLAGARQRNLDLVDRINRRLPDAAVDYGKDVVPLTPAGNATERHIIRAYLNKAIEVFEHPDSAARFWMDVLGLTFDETLLLMADGPAMEEKVRSRLAKRGGLGYVQPTSGTFPPVNDFFALVRSCGAIPMIAWLDGTSPGEQEPARLLEAMHSSGAAALNIIPDRNWNIRDPKQRAVKLARLREIVALCEARHMPVNIGTEMNRLGLPFFDDLSGEALSPYRDTFLRGARIMVGQSILARYADCAYAGDRAAAEYPAIEQRNRFFEAVGALPPLDSATESRLVKIGPEQAFAHFRDAIAKVDRL